MKNSYASPSSSPSSPPSPLPVSVGPGNQAYFFSSSSSSSLSPSPSPSPPFSPPPSSHTSAENHPFLHEKQPSPKRPPSAFSLDHPQYPHDQLDSKTSCLQDLLKWLVERCCSNSSWCPSKSRGIAHSQINLAFEVVRK